MICSANEPRVGGLVISHGLYSSNLLAEATTWENGTKVVKVASES